jgi:dihydroorotate dehydrogenase (NAD+) catalytic subunit
VRLGPVRLANPVLTASGTFGYGLEIRELSRVSKLGGIVTKTITLEPRAGNPPPRICETPSGMLNSIGLQNVGLEIFLREKLPELRALGIALVVSVGGRRAEEFAAVARQLDDVDGIAALELNISCPNVAEGGLEFCQLPESAAQVVAQVRKVTRRPLWAKLSPNVTSIGVIARACEEAGADGLTAVNTFVGLCIDPHTRRGRLYRGKGGLSGPAIRPLALAKVREVVRSVGIPVIGVGGIASGADALEFLIAGASAVQVGTASFLDPASGARIVEEIAQFVQTEGLSHVEEIIGSYLEAGE